MSGRQRAGQWRRCREHAGADLRHAFTAERPFFGQELEQQDPERPHIGALIDERGVLHLLG